MFQFIGKKVYPVMGGWGNAPDEERCIGRDQVKIVRDDRVFLVSVLQAEIAFDGQVNAPERVPDRLNVFRPFRDSGAESGDQQLKIKSADKTELRMPDAVIIMVA